MAQIIEMTGWRERKAAQVQAAEVSTLKKERKNMNKSNPTLRRTTSGAWHDTTQQTGNCTWPNADSYLYFKFFLGSACALIGFAIIFAISGESVYMDVAEILALSAFVAYAMGTDGMNPKVSSLAQYASLFRRSNTGGTDY